ncbi:MAG: sulfatase-like hydrolase/transferase [Spirochaetaceae bacterium]|nr:MAG: sulfatase-like hydrolase/transferase [Spirochaetaceae bacterium]
MSSLLFRLPGLIEDGGGFARILSPSFDVALLALVVCLFTWADLPGFTAVAAVLAMFAMTVLSFQAADALIPVFFDRPFELFTDITYVPDLYALLRDTMPGWLFYTGLIALAGVLGGLGFGLFTGFRLLRRGFQHRNVRHGFLLLLAVLLVLDLLSPFRFTANTALPRITEEAVKIAQKDRFVQEQQEAFSKQVQESSRVMRPLEGLEGEDVYLFIVESYGYTLYSEPVHFDMILPELREFEDRLTRAGYRIASTFVDSPAFGGNSWLADSSLATGVRIDNEAAYQLLHESDVKPMAQFFNEIGYRTVVAMPATTYAWPEGEFYRFTEKYYYKDFGYRGPNLKWAPMTDQFVVDFIHRNEVERAGQPLFIQYVMISSHYPFNLIPKYFEDWSQIGDGSIYHREDSVTVLPIKPGNQTAGAEGYVASMAYEMKLIREYLSNFVDGEALIIVLGDHQPYSGITGKNKPWSVPFHLISRNPDFLESFLDRGYTKGLIPTQKPPHPGLETFLPMLLESFSSTDPATGRRSAGRRSAAVKSEQATN